MYVWCDYGHHKLCSLASLFSVAELAAPWAELRTAPYPAQANTDTDLKTSHIKSVPCPPPPSTPTTPCFRRGASLPGFFLQLSPGKLEIQVMPQKQGVSMGAWGRGQELKLQGSPGALGTCTPADGFWELARGDCKGCVSEITGTDAPATGALFSLGTHTGVMRAS